MKRLIALAALLNSCGVFADNLQIVVTNFASQRPAVNGVAPGSIIRIQPYFFSSSSGVSFHSYSSSDGLSLRVRSAGATSDTPIPFIPSTPEQPTLKAVLPSSLPFGNASLIFTEQGQDSDPAPIAIVPSNFGLSVNSAGGAVAQMYSSDGEVSLNQLSNAAQRGQIIALWGTGLGTAASVTVKLGGRDLIPMYAGSVDSLSGVNQINIQIPADAPLGCYVPLTIAAGGLLSNTATLAIADQGAICNHPWNLSFATLAALEANDTIILSPVTLTSQLADNPVDKTYQRQESATAPFLRAGAAQVASSSGFTIPADAFPWCRVGDSSLSGFITQVFDAGTGVTLTGPSGKVLNLLSGPGGGFYSVTIPSGAPSSSPPASFFDAGVWKFHVPGGKSIPAFDSQITIPPSLGGTNVAAVSSIDSTKDQTITWDPMGQPQDAIVEASLTYQYQLYPNLAITQLSTIATCRAPASAGQVTLPASILKQITSNLIPATTAQLQLTLLPSSAPVLTVPLSKTDSMVNAISYRFSETAPVQVK